MFENFPYTNFHDLNLDWLIQKIMESYGPDNPPPVGLVLSVNGETGAVILYKDAIVRLPDIDETSWNIHRVADGNSSGIEFVNGQPAMRIDGINRYKIFDEGFLPSYPVESVDGMTGDVKTWANQQTASLLIPGNAQGNVWDISRNIPNGIKTGIEIEYDSVNNVYKAYITHTVNGVTSKDELLTSAVIPSSSVVSVNGLSGIVVLTGENVAIASGSQQSIKNVTDGLANLINGQNGESLKITSGSNTSIKSYIDSQSSQLSGPTYSALTLSSGLTPVAGRNFLIQYGKMITLYFCFTNTEPLAGGGVLQFALLNPNQYHIVGRNNSVLYSFTAQVYHNNYANTYALRGNINANTGGVALINSSGVAIPADYNYNGFITFYVE